VASSLGIAVVPACMKSSRADSVRYVPLRASGLSASLGIAYRASGITPALRNMLALVPQARKARVEDLSAEQNALKAATPDSRRAARST
jgi:hypothetical protein